LLTAALIVLAVVGAFLVFVLVQDVAYFFLGHESYVLGTRKQIVRIPCDRINVSETKRVRREG
jgi:hypothetical protein